MLENVVLFWGVSDYINVLFQHNDITTSNSWVFLIGSYSVCGVK